MAKEASFDIVSKVEVQEVTNAVNQTDKELNQRFDLKGTNCSVEWDSKEIINIKAPDEMKLRNVLDILKEKFIKRNISLKSIEEGDIESALGGTVKQEIKIKQGIDKDNAKKINTLIKNSKIKVSSQLQEDQIRVMGKNIDDLQAVMKICKASDIELDLQYINFRS